MLQIEGIILDRKLHPSGLRLSLFTPEGLLSVWTRKPAQSAKKTCARQSLTQPLTLVSCLLKSKANKSYQLIEGRALNSFLGLRKNFDCLNAAQQMSRLLLQTQSFDKPAPSLYQTLFQFLKGLEQGLCPKGSYAGFFMKLLKYEGTLAEDLGCLECSRPSQRLFKGHFYCNLHGPLDSRSLSEEESQVLKQLAQIEHLGALEHLKVSECLRNKLIEPYSKKMGE